MSNLPPFVVFDSKTNSLIDYIHTGESDTDALTRLASYGTGLTVLPTEEAWQRHEDAAKTEPEEITSEKWIEMLEVLPPVAWKNDIHGESFKLVERTTGLITGIYVHLENRFFTFQDSITTPHADCCHRVRASKAFTCPDEGKDEARAYIAPAEPEETPHGYAYPTDTKDL